MLRFVFWVRYGNIHPVKLGQTTRLWWTSAIALLLLIFGFRTYELLQIAPGLTDDEASNGHAILSAVHRLYFPVGCGHDPLYTYSVALLTLFLGQEIYTLRITTVFWSLMQVTLTTPPARRWWDRKTAQGMLAGYAVSFWALMNSKGVSPTHILIPFSPTSQERP